jgi:hypothetical protein
MFRPLAVYTPRSAAAGKLRLKHSVRANLELVSSSPLHGKSVAERGAHSTGFPQSGLVMSTHLYFTTPQTPHADPAPSIEHPKTHDRTAQPTTSGRTVPADRPVLRLVAAFEDGRVEHWECQEWSKRTDPRMAGTRQGEFSAVSGGWRNLWTQKVHNEAGTSSSFSV